MPSPLSPLCRMMCLLRIEPDLEHFRSVSVQVPEVIDEVADVEYPLVHVFRAVYRRPFAGSVSRHRRAPVEYAVAVGVRAA